MKNRILSFLLAVAMALGLCPTFAMAQQTDPVSIAAFATAAVDGSLSEQDWLTCGQLSDGTDSRAFGTLWDSENLYLAVIPEANDQILTVRL